MPLTNLELSDPEIRWATMSFLFLDVSLKLIYRRFPVRENRLRLQGLDWVLWTFQNVHRQLRDAFSVENRGSN